MHPDFIIKYDPAKDTPNDITRRILYSMYIRRIQMKKPVVTFIGGDSGEGKSESGGLGLQKVLCDLQGLDLNEYMSDINVTNPLEYPTKMKALLYDKRLRKVNIICLHEARDIIRATQWQNFLTQAVADVNAQSRSIKRMMFFIISQFIRDITLDIRYTLNYYIKVYRPMSYGARAHLFINVVWRDDRDIEKARLRKRRLQGYLVYPNGKRQKYIPKYLEMQLPDKELVNKFEDLDRESKAHITEMKLNKLLFEIEKEAGISKDKITPLVDYYANHKEILESIAKQKNGRYFIERKFFEAQNMDKKEIVIFEERLNEKLKLKEKQYADALKEQGVVI
jgi:hypothetical protein